MAPHIYTIAPDRAFLATLAQGLLELAGGDPLMLPRMTILLPTRRAARALREAFLRLTAEGKDPGAPLLLPRLRPIGDLDDDEIGQGLGGGEGDDPSLAVPPAIPELRRRLLLTQLVLRWSKAGGEVDGEPGLLPGQAASLAAALARLLDAAASEEQSFDKLCDLVPDEEVALTERATRLRERTRVDPRLLPERKAVAHVERAVGGRDLHVLRTVGAHVPAGNLRPGRVPSPRTVRSAQRPPEPGWHLGRCEGGPDAVDPRSEAAREGHRTEDHADHQRATTA